MKAIIEMSLDELRLEYLNCVVAAGDSSLSCSERIYYSQRCKCIKERILELT